MTDETTDTQSAIRALVKEIAEQKERVDILTKIVKNHEHDKRDGCTKFDVGYL